MAKKDELNFETDNKLASSEKLKALQAAMEKIEKSFGKGSIMKMGDDSVEQVEVIPTGSIALNVALGGTLHQDIRSGVSEDALQHVQGRPFDMPAHMVDVVEGSRLESIVEAPRLGVNTIHHQSVDELGEGLVVNAVSPDDGIIEGIELPGDLFVVGVQWHPEHMWRTRPHSKRLFRAFVDAARG